MMDSYQPLFQRIDHDDYTELQLLVDNLSQRIRNLEKFNKDLESRLENEAKNTINLEKECVTIEKTWNIKYKQLEDELEKYKTELESEKVKNERLRDHLSRTERELYGILQRKYEFMRNGSKVNNTNTRSTNPNGWDLGFLRSNEIDETQQLRAPKDIRQKRITTDLKQFLGL